MLNNMHLPFMDSNSLQVFRSENGVSKYSNEEHEFIDDFNLFDLITLGINGLFFWYNLNLYLNNDHGDFYNDELRIYSCFEI